MLNKLYYKQENKCTWDNGWNGSIFEVFNFDLKRLHLPFCSFIRIQSHLNPELSLLISHDLSFILSLIKSSNSIHIFCEFCVNFFYSSFQSFPWDLIAFSFSKASFSWVSTKDKVSRWELLMILSNSCQEDGTLHNAPNI